MVLVGWQEPSVKADLGTYSNMLSVPRYCLSVPIILIRKLHFSSLPLGMVVLQIQYIVITICGKILEG